jgi:hypothetical protein
MSGLCHMFPDTFQTPDTKPSNTVAWSRANERGAVITRPSLQRGNLCSSAHVDHKDPRMTGVGCGIYLVKKKTSKAKVLSSSFGVLCSSWHKVGVDRRSAILGYSDRSSPLAQTETAFWRNGCTMRIPCGTKPTVRLSHVEVELSLKNSDTRSGYRPAFSVARPLVVYIYIF